MAIPSRRRKGLKTKKSMLLVCEGTHTEVSYFESIRQLLRKPNVTVEVHGEGKSQMALLDAAKAKIKNNKRDIVSSWVVFDKDDVTREQIEKTSKKAKERSIKVGFTNICFELWLLMHFQKVGNPIDKKQLYRALESYLEITNYEKLKGDWELIEKIAYKYKTAIKNNKKLFSSQSDKFTNPYSNIFEILEEIEEL
ncbi:RloB family protein [Virgibacillus siamensis]|uniref:RloB family protein n=1 Tax=Virgibacillus siamensis TaxID=480071 RepID=A0ABP3RGM8_9BACI